MFLVHELNQKKLFQRTSKFILNERCRELLPQIYYRASACIISFERIEQYQKRCIYEYTLFDDQVNLEHDSLIFVSPVSISILNEVTPILSSLRILQNLYVELLSKYYQISLPSSMNDFQKKITRYSDIPDEIKEQIKKYWETSGAYVKSLRDIDQHFYNLIEYSFMSLKDSKEIVIRFPDNPEDKKPSSFRFSNQIDGLKFLKRAFIEINELYENLSNFLGYEEKPIIFSLNLKHILSSQVNKKRTVFMLYQQLTHRFTSNKAQLRISATMMNLDNDGNIEISENGLTEAKNSDLNRKLKKNPTFTNQI